MFLEPPTPDSSDLVARTTEDAGATWSDIVLLRKSGLPPAATTSFAYDATGTGVWAQALRQSDLMRRDVAIGIDSGGDRAWKHAGYLLSDPASEGGWHMDATVATDGQGEWYVMWSASRRLSGVVSRDYDIVIARSSDLELRFDGLVVE
jgi:hypothetical protein